MVEPVIVTHHLEGAITGPGKCVGVYHGSGCSCATSCKPCRVCNMTFAKPFVPRSESEQNVRHIFGMQLHIPEYPCYFLVQGG